VFRNVGILNSDAGELPGRKHTTFRTRRKFEIKKTWCFLTNVLVQAKPLAERLKREVLTYSISSCILFLC
jgi:hypothetical protein